MFSEGVKTGLEVYITRDDRIRFPEHRVQHTERSVIKPSVTTCFLESEEGSVFTIVVNVERTLELGPESAWRATVRVDGRIVDRIVKGNKQSAPMKVSTMVSEENGKLVRGRLTFPKVQRNSDEGSAVIVPVAQLRLMGQISVTFERGFRVKTQGLRRALIAQSDMEMASEKEKQIGGVADCTRQAPYDQILRFVRFYPVDIHMPFHVITFNYRTRLLPELMRVIEGPVLQVPNRHAEARGNRVMMRHTVVEEEKTVVREEETAVEAEEIVVKKEDLADVKTSRKALLAARLKNLERQLEMAIALPRAEGRAEVVDLTGDDSD